MVSDEAAARDVSESPGALRRLWKRLPRPLRFYANVSGQAAAAAARPLRVAMNWRRGLAAGPTVHVAGLFSASSGVGRSARLFAQALEDVGVPVVRLDVGAAASQAFDLSSPGEGGDRGRPGILVSHLNPPELMRWLAGPGARALRGRRHVGYWFWELPQAPKAWRSAVRYVDEVWCQSRFTRDAVAGLGADAPVRVSPHPVFSIPRLPPDRARFGLGGCGCAVLTSFDLHSSSARKNPLGALEAFLRAAPRADASRAVLVCKARHLDADPATAMRLRAAAAARPDIRLLDQPLSDGDMASLMASVDVVLSLHRAEGFGLVPAEGLWAGRAVVATAWSGVLDFLDADCAELVRYSLAPVHDPQNIYAGGLWAEPDLDDAAARLVRLIDDPEHRRGLQARALARADVVFSRDAWLGRTLPMLGLAPIAPTETLR